MPNEKNEAVDAYLNALPDDRRTVISKVRDVIRKNLPAGYAEGVGSGMLAYVIPLERYPKTYNGQPLAYVSLAAQKNYYALYLVGAYQDPKLADRLADGFRAAGKKLDMGKSCVRFKKLDDLALEVVGEVIASTPVEEFIRQHEAARAKR
jgi:hypothetical protein